MNKVIQDQGHRALTTIFLGRATIYVLSGNIHRLGHILAHYSSSSTLLKVQMPLYILDKV